MYEVNGFIFESEELAETARKEAEAIKYIKAQTRMDDPENVLELYNKVLQKKMFETPVGMAFLVELQEYLRTIPFIKNEEISGIPVRNTKTSKSKQKVKTKVVKEVRDDGYKGRYHFTLIVTFVLSAIIVGMFAITYLSGNNTNIINYENQLINKYENWEEQLKEKEAELDARESALQKGENDGQN